MTTATAKPLSPEHDEPAPRSERTKTPYETIVLPDGAVARRSGDALLLTDREGRLLVRYENGSAEIAAPAGDLTLSAPEGRVVLRSGLDVEIVAARDLRTEAARSLSFGTGEGGAELRIEPESAHIKAASIAVEAQKSRLVTGEATVLARHIATTANHIAIAAERYELTATRLVEKSRDTFREVTDLAQSRIGRVRTRVLGVFSLKARRSLLVSKEETKIDGKKVLLG